MKDWVSLVKKAWWWHMYVLVKSGSYVIEDMMPCISINRNLCFRAPRCLHLYDSLRNGLIQLSKKWTTLMMEAAGCLKHCYLFTNLHSIISPEDGNHLQHCCESLISQCILLILFSFFLLVILYVGMIH